MLDSGRGEKCRWVLAVAGKEENDDVDDDDDDDEADEK